MLTGTYLLADAVFSVTSLHDEVHSLCADYRTEAEPRYHIVTTQADIDREGDESDRQREVEGLPPFRFSDAYLETLAIYRQAAETLLPEGVLLMHGSTVAVDGQGYMFTALSGTGKSTHVALWRKLFGARAVMVNDDKPLVRIKSDGSVWAYGTPWDGKHHLSTRTSVPLRAIVVLRRGAENHIRPLTPIEAFPMLWQQTYHPAQPEASRQALHLLEALARQVRFYELHCNMDPDAAQVAYDGMQATV